MRTNPALAQHDARGRFVSVDPAIRLWSKVAGPWNTPDVGDADCWYFGGRARNRWGYPRFHWPAHSAISGLVGAHIAAFIVTRGPVPEGTVVCHSCNHKMCCNPAHLFAASQSENIKQWWRDRRRPAA
jgi:hypothetical protein